MIMLPAHCSTTAAQNLLPDFLDHADRGANIVVDGSAVDVVGQAMLQLLAAAKADADATGRTFAIDPVSDPLAARIVGCKLEGPLGLDAQDSKGGEE